MSAPQPVFPLAPRARLVWLALLVAAPLLAFGAQPGLGWLAALGLPALAGWCALDARAGRRRLATLEATPDPLTRMTLDRAGGIGVRLESRTGAAARPWLRLALPPEFDPDGGVLHAELTAGAPPLRFEIPALPRRRGRFTLDAVYLEHSSPAGLWSCRRLAPAAGDIRVYPSLDRERRRHPALFIARGGSGARRQRAAGKGREFEKLREWSSGDDLTDIHWKATARRGHPVTKEFQIERTQEIYVVIDASRLSARRPPVESRIDAARGGAAPESGAAEASVLERFVTAALVLALAAERQGDRCGLLTFSDRVHGFVRAGSGRGHYQALRHALHELHPRAVSPDFDDVTAFLRVRLRRRALILFLTDIDDPVHAEQFQRNLELLTRHHLVLAGMLNPAGAAPLFNRRAEGVDGLYEQLAGHLLWRRLQELRRSLRSRGVALEFLSNERLAPELVARYLQVKARQLL